MSGMPAMADATCPSCGLEWEENCEQHVCIQLFGECIACRFMPNGKGSRSGTLADMDRITAQRKELLVLQRSRPVPNALFGIPGHPANTAGEEDGNG